MIAAEEMTSRQEQATRLLEKMRSIPGRFTYSEERCMELAADGCDLTSKQYDRYKHLCMMELKEEAI